MPRLRLFGHPALEMGESRMPLGLPGKAVAMVALVAANAERPISRDWLAQRVWPDSDRPQARASLRRQLHLTLRTLGEDAFVLTHETLQWNASGTLDCDVVSFDSLRTRDPAAAIEQYAGELCAGIVDESLEQPRLRYRSRYEQLLRAAIESARDAGDATRMRLWLQRLITYDPLDEDAVRALMRARIDSGDRSAALRDYAALRQRLMTELGVAPQRETADLFSEIVANAGERSSPNNLAAATTTFVGREPELNAVAQALEESRAVTLTGPAGIGKSRLALRSASDMLQKFAAGVWFVDLEHARSQEDIWQRIADSCGVPPSDRRERAVLAHLRDRSALIVLDTCEHVAAYAEDVVRTLLSHTLCRVLATSRKRLNIPESRDISVPALDIPPQDIPSGDSAIRYSAYRLFVERAALASPAFRVEPRHLPALIALLRNIDAIPLAIELLASRTNVLSVDGLRRRFAQAMRTARSGEGRNRTLDAALSWSYDMLAGAQRETFALLGAFQGTFSADDAERVCKQIPSAVETLFELVDASLVSVVTRPDDVRYRLLETTREFAFEKLRSGQRVDAARCAHAEHFASKARDLAAALETTFPALLASVTDAMPDYVAALDYAARTGAGEIAVHLIEGLYRFALRGHFRFQVLAGARTVLDCGRVAGAHRARIARLTAVLAENRESVELFGEAIAYYRDHGDDLSTCDALSGLAATYWRLGNYDECERLLLEVRAALEGRPVTSVLLKCLSRLGTLYGAKYSFEQSAKMLGEIGQQLEQMGEIRQAAQTYKNIAANAFHAGRYADALQWGAKALDLTSATSEVALRLTLLTLCGCAEQERGNLQSAAQWHLQACAIVPALGECQEVAESFEDIANTLAAAQAFREAAQLGGFAERMRERLAFPLNPRERSAYDRMCAVLREKLADGFALAWAAQSVMGIDHAAALAHSALNRLQT